MPNRVTPLDLAQGNENDSILFTILSSLFPPTLISILAKISNFLWSTLSNNQNDPSSWLSTLLPPLLSLFLLYLSLLAAYRTMRSTIRLFIFTIKWGLILGSLIAIYAVYTGSDQSLDSMGQVPISRGGLVRGVGKALGWAGTGSMIPSLLVSALPFLNSNDQDPIRTRNSNSRSRTRSSRSQGVRRSPRNRNRNSNDLNYDNEDDHPDINSNPLMSSLESLVKNLLNKNPLQQDDDDEESYYQRTGLRRNSVRSSSTRRRNRGSEGSNRNVGREINQAINDLTGLDLNLDDLNRDGNLNVEDILRKANDLLDGGNGNGRERRNANRNRNQDGAGGLIQGLVGSFFGR